MSLGDDGATVVDHDDTVGGGEKRGARGEDDRGTWVGSVPEFEEAFSVALIVGGSIVIPHLRRAYARMDEVLVAAG